jgi:hypothetical protein
MEEADARRAERAASTTKEDEADEDGLEKGAGGDRRRAKREPRGRGRGRERDGPGPRDDGRRYVLATGIGGMVPLSHNLVLTLK